MNIQSVLNAPITSSDGKLTPAWRDFLSQFFLQMQQNFSQEGLVVPQQSTTNINTLNTAQSTGALLYDNQLNELKVNINGTFKVVQVM